MNNAAARASRHFCIVVCRYSVSTVQYALLCQGCCIGAVDSDLVGSSTMGTPVKSRRQEAFNGPTWLARVPVCETQNILSSLYFNKIVGF
jgi:hypothetical protein